MSVDAKPGESTWTRCSKQHPCPKCGDDNQWCSVSADGNMAKCRRESDGAYKNVVDAGGPAYFHRLNSSTLKRTTQPTPGREAHDNTIVTADDSTESAAETKLEVADADFRHVVYSAILDALPAVFPDAIVRDLHRRGLTDAEIRRRQYRFVPGSGRGALVAAPLAPVLQRFGKRIATVPGVAVVVVQDFERVELSAGGLLIPVRDIAGRIIRLKVRKYGPAARNKSRYFWLGKGGGSVAHVPLGITAPAALVRITEGELKADIATALSGVATVSAPGVTAWRLAVDTAKELGAKTVRLAFDSDKAENPIVARAVVECFKTCVAADVAVEMEDWPKEQGKGIDDVLAAGHKPKLLAGDATTQLITLLTSACTMVNEADDDPHRLARLFVARQCTFGAVQTLRFWRDEWLRWDGSAYIAIPTAEVKAELCRIVKQEFDRLNLEKPPKEDGTLPTATKVTTGLLTNAMGVLSSLTLLPCTTAQPSWLDHADPFPADEVLATKSALIHLPSLVAGSPSTLPPTPQFFSAGVVDYGFDPNAGCPEWHKFLESIWPDDPQSADSLQEWFGYLLLPDTRQHKLLILIGPPRSGKGTIARTLKGLIGKRNLASPTLSSLAGQFGLWPLLGKTVALIPEARLGHKADAIAVVERLLSISGEDPQDVDRKNLPTIAGAKLSVRFVLMTNELPNLRDSSGAFVNRVVLLRTTRSWLGKEDKQLDARLQCELPGILNWAIGGWQRLEERGWFLQPDSGRELLSDLDDLVSPISQFVRETCIVGPEFATPIDVLFVEWRKWCEQHGRQHPGTRETFGKDLRAKLPGLKVSQPRTNTGERIRVYNGIVLRSGTGWHASHTPAREGSLNLT